MGKKVETELVQTRLTKGHMLDLERISQAEGLSIASWLRRMIIKEINFANTGIDGWIVPARPLTKAKKATGT